MSNYPIFLDNEENLYTVYDSLKVILAKDYNPGDSSIVVDGDIERFPLTGIITLIDQCSDPYDRAISFKYKNKSNNAFLSIEPCNNTNLSFKPKKITNVMMQVRAEHHNAIKDSIIKIQEYLGTNKTIDKEPYGPTIIGRLNFLKNLLFTPKAWFEANSTIGLVPFTVEFTSKSSGVTGNVGTVKYQWDFGDGFITETNVPYISKTYYTPGVYDVALTVSNIYGEDTVKLTNLIKARIEAPEAAKINFNVQSGQLLLAGEECPVIRTPSNQFVLLEVLQGEDEKRKNISHAGELLDNNKKPIDSIINYSWLLGDNLPHGNNASTRAAYSLGGLYNITLRTDTALGSYRTTNYKNCIDIVEIYNLWLWNHDNNHINAYEYGMNSESFKIKRNVNHNILLNDSFLEDKKQKYEFKKNNGMVAKNNTPSGLGGECELFWATGRSAEQPSNFEKIDFARYNGFTDTYTTSMKSIARPWNWTSFISKDYIYIILGQSKTEAPAGISPVNLSRVNIDLYTMTSNEIENGYDYTNGAQDLAFNVANFNKDGTPQDGHYSKYRTAWKDQIGYLLKNNTVGEFFTLKNFYKTLGTIGSPFISMMKLNNIPGNGKKEGRLVPLHSGIFLFDNTGSPLMYRENTMTWEIVPVNSGLFSQLQDKKIIDNNNESNTLLAVSDGDRKVFLSFDYSEKTFIKFNEANLTFSSTSPRPFGEQWQMGIF